MKRLILMMLLICLLCNSACTAIGNTGDYAESDPILSTDAPEMNEKLVQEIQGTIFVNDIQLEACSYLRIYTDDICNIAIPVLAVVKALGAQVCETNTGVFQIEYGGKLYIFDTNSKELHQEGEKWNLIRILPGGRNSYRERRGNDFYVDNISLLSFLETIGAEIKYSYSTGEVIIGTREPSPCP